MILNYIKYHKEIKSRFIILFLTWLYSLNICYLFKEKILLIIINSNTFLFETNNKPYFIYTNITEIFYMYLEIIIFISNQVGIITLLYQILMFLSLGLYYFEITRLNLIFQTFFISWVLCSITLLKILIPFSWNFFLSFQENLANTQPISFFFEAKLDEYLQHYISLYTISLISCLFFSIMGFVFNELDNKLKKKLRKPFYLMVMVFSTFITPPDVINQMLISFILIFIYELFLFIKEILISMANN